jgi:hypothetical protein
VNSLNAKKLRSLRKIVKTKIEAAMKEHGRVPDRREGAKIVRQSVQAYTSTKVDNALPLQLPPKRFVPSACHYNCALFNLLTFVIE